MIPCPTPEKLRPFVADLDSSIETEQEAWLDEKNKNITRNMEFAKNCAESHAVLVAYIDSLPEC